MKNIAIILFGAVISSSCYYDKLEDLHPNTNLKCDSVNINYQNHISVIMKNQCTSCHNAQNKGGNINLDNYTDVKQCGESGKLLSSVIWDGNASAMPKGSSTKIDACSINQLKSWINTNYPQ